MVSEAGAMRESPTTPIRRTRDLGLAAYWRAGGLRLLEANAVEDAHRVVFIFSDPENRERALTSAYFNNGELQRLLRARSDLAHALYRAQRDPSRRCSGEDLDVRV